MTYYRRNKKGQHLALIAYGLISIFIVVIFLVMAFVMAEVNTAIQGTDLFGDSQKAQLNSNVSRLPAIFDTAYVTVMILSSLVMVASVFFIPTHPIFVFISLPIFAITVLGNAVFANAIETIGTSSVFASTYAQFPMTSALAHNWIAITVVVGLLSIVAFAAAKGGGGQ